MVLIVHGCIYKEDAPEIAFYHCAANLWNYRSYERGNRAAAARMKTWVEASSGKPLLSAFLTERLRGTADGRALNALGFLFFEAGREYTLNGMDADGAVTVSAYESEDGPDEDGFGRETYYDWWHLDDNLSLVPEVTCLHRYSSIDRRIQSVQQRFRESHDKVARIVAMKREQAGDLK